MAMGLVLIRDQFLRGSVLPQVPTGNLTLLDLVLPQIPLKILTQN